MLRTSSAVRVLGSADRDAALAVCARDPVANAFVASRLLEDRAFAMSAGEVWGFVDRGELVSLCWAGANLVPVEATAPALDGFAARARRAGRRCSSILGPAAAVLALWDRLERPWWPAREVRADQPLLALDGDPLVTPDPLVRRARPSETDLVVPASAAMFQEEIGFSPIGRDGGVSYRLSVAHLVSSGRTFVRMDPDVPEAIFKADLASVTPQVAQIQGVWVAPRLRGQGLAAPAMAAVSAITRREIAPVVSLYVNSYNAPALAAYRRVGLPAGRHLRHRPVLTGGSTSPSATAARSWRRPDTAARSAAEAVRPSRARTLGRAGPGPDADQAPGSGCRRGVRSAGPKNGGPGCGPAGLGSGPHLVVAPEVRRLSPNAEESAVPLRMSTLFLRTLREDPADAELPSHRLLVRGGYIRRVAPGIYTWLPLGLRVLRKVEAIVREEMDAAGAQELLFPALLPREPYEETGRWEAYGDGIFRLKDRKDNDYLLGPTHEEMFTLTVKDLFSSYKDLPLALYQIQTKYRDEARPRAGILRGREFVMKDSYSFDVSDEAFLASYQLHRDAYIRIFARLGLRYVIVAAMSGAMGGSASEEFLATAENGEDTYVRCTNCDYAANVEAVRVPVPPVVDASGTPAAHVEDTPDTPTIATLVDLLNERFPRGDRAWQADDTLKNVVVMVRQPDGTREPLAIGVPGGRDVDEKRLQAQLEPAVLEPFTEEDFARNPALTKGYIGPRALGEQQASGIRFVVDPRVVDGTAWVTGADQAGHHVLDLVAGRDFTPDGTIEAAEVREGDPCPVDGAPLTAARGIEMGHIFQLGRKYAEALGLKVLDQNGKQVTVTMGSYGVGVSRAVGAVAEQTLDEIGLCWPRSIAPADVHLVATGKDDEVFAAAERIVAGLEAHGLEVLYDDRRGVSPGVKFKDAELLGMPTIVVVGRGLADGVVEVRERRTGERAEVPVGDAVARIVAQVRR